MKAINKQFRLPQHLAALCGVLLGVISIPALGATTWNVDGCSVATLQSAGTGCGSAGNSVHAYAYSVDNSPATSTFSDSNVLLENAGTSFGLMVNSPDDSHALDNSSYTDLIAFRFDQSVILDTVKFGWTSTDVDFSLFAWTGPSTPSYDASDKIEGLTADELATTSTSGWRLVGNYAYSPGATQNTDVLATVNTGAHTNGDIVSSSWWIVSAYNSNYGGNSAGNLSNYNDYMKIITIASKDPSNDNGKVSEPASLLVLGVGLVGMMTLRRRTYLKK